MAKYYSTHRPIGIGCYPKPDSNRIVKIANFDERMEVEDYGKPVWGYIEYEYPLDERVASDYQLEEAGYRWWHEVQFKVAKEDDRILAARYAGVTWAKTCPDSKYKECKRFDVLSKFYYDKKFAEAMAKRAQKLANG